MSTLLCEPPYLPSSEVKLCHDLPRVLAQDRLLY